MSVDIQVETANKTAAISRLRSFGLKTGENDVTDIVTLDLADTINGLTYFSFRVPDDLAHVIPSNNNPTFTIVWRSDEFDEDGNLLPKPLVEVKAFDIDGNPDGTRFQGICSIQ